MDKLLMNDDCHEIFFCQLLPFTVELFDKDVSNAAILFDIVSNSCIVLVINDIVVLFNVLCFSTILFN